MNNRTFYVGERRKIYSKTRIRYRVYICARLVTLIKRNLAPNLLALPCGREIDAFASDTVIHLLSPRGCRHFVVRRLRARYGYIRIPGYWIPRRVHYTLQRSFSPSTPFPIFSSGTKNFWIIHPQCTSAVTFEDKIPDWGKSKTSHRHSGTFKRFYPEP